MTLDHQRWGARSGNQPWRPLRMPVPSTFWQANLAGWLFIAVLGITIRTIFFGNFSDALVRTAVCDCLGFGLTGLAHRVIRDHIRSPLPAIRAIPIAAAACVAGGMVMLGVVQIMRQLATALGLPFNDLGGTYIPVLYYTIIFLGWALAYFWLTADHAVRAERVQRSEAESAAARAELQQLRTQLDPHFLFNALNTVTAEIPERPDVALEMTRRISDYMRYCLDHQDRLACRLADEIDAVRAYLRIQELRYDGRLSCAVRLEPEAADFAVPHLILQGLVENAVKHSLRPAMQAPLQITVSASLQDGHLSITVTNPGIYAPRPEGRPGLGLANMRRRLELHYPDGHHILVAQEEELVCTRLILRGPLCFA
ncbi:histidine kinase [Xanthobacter sp. DSM 24535]|uniref:sensor histidine kinase n=1 Tax=Roseixanthobacter psychrophilus TaxID=3119917 RepID=UPI00372C9A81